MHSSTTDLQDLRAKITRRAHVMLLAKSQATGRDISQLAREVLDAWAADEIHAASVMARVLRGEGYLGESEGKRGERAGKSGE